MSGATEITSAHPQQRATTVAEPRRVRSDNRVVGAIALAGVALSIVGSILNQVVADVDIFEAMETSSAADRARLLTDVAAEQTPLVAGFVIWMIAFPLVAIASIGLARLSRPSALTVAVSRVATASIGAMMVFLTMFVTFVIVIAPAHVAGEDVSTLAHTVGWLAATIDWVVTAAVLGLAPVVAVWTGRKSWAPRWLVGLAGVAAMATAVEIVGLVTDHRALTFPIVPIGLLLVGAAGACAMLENTDEGTQR
jgi:hypothetical protein